MQHEVHDLNRGVDNAQFLLLLRERNLKKLVKKLDDDLLSIADALDIAHPVLDAVVEALQLIVGAFKTILIELIEHARHGAGNDIALTERIVRKECVQHGLNNNVLGEHFHHVIRA